MTYIQKEPVSGREYVYLPFKGLIYLDEICSPSCDIPLLRKHLEWVESQAQLSSREREWKQSYWASVKNIEKLATGSCGSYRCFAGNVCFQAGDTFVSDKATKDGDIISSVLTVEGKYMTIADRAQELLGITCAAADALFMSSNTARDVRVLCELIADEKL